MALDRCPSNQPSARSPVVLGAGLTGMAISRALASAKIAHVLIGDRPTATPRLGESLNPEGSLEIARQFPELAHLCHPKQRQVLFFGEHAVSFHSLQNRTTRAYESLAGYPATVQLLHVDRVGFDRALFEMVVQDEHCTFIEDRAAALDYYPPADRIDAVRLAGGTTIDAAYVFDATNHVRFVARNTGVRCRVIGEPRRVVFAHYHATGRVTPPSLGWTDTTSLLRFDARRDSAEGLAWCIPLGRYVSLGISVDPEKVGAHPELLLAWVERAFAARGIDVRSAFGKRGAPLDIPYEHYNHERCYGRNWLLTGPSCCQFWFPSAAGVATGLVAARLAPEVLRDPRETPAVYQAYVDDVARSHPMLEWLAGDEPSSVTSDDLRQRSASMVQGNVESLRRWLALSVPPRELEYGDALSRYFESERRITIPVRIDTAPPAAQGTQVFSASAAADLSVDRRVEIPVLEPPDRLDVPRAVALLIDVLSGRLDAAASAALLTLGFQLRIDQFTLHGTGQWTAWVTSLRQSARVAALELVAGSATGADDRWTVHAQWRGLVGGLHAVSPEFPISFLMHADQVAIVGTRREDYTFITGDAILYPVAFAALMGGLAAADRGVVTV